MIYAKYVNTPIEINKFSDSQLISLQEYLSQYGRQNCPECYYVAWKILILGSNEYKKNQDAILERAINKFESEVKFCE